MKNKKNDPCPFCNGSNKIVVDHDIGFDVHEEGEERQHIDRCGCGGWRFHVDYISFDSEKSGVYFGKWNPKDDQWGLENLY